MSNFKQFSIRLPTELVDDLDKIQKDTSRSRTKVIEIACYALVNGADGEVTRGVLGLEQEGEDG